MEAHLAETIRRLGGSGLADADRDALLSYVGAIPPVPRAEREPSEEARRGEAVFRDKGCSGCHDEATGYSDHVAHDVGGGGPTVTPSLVGVGARGRLFHDGRFAGLDALLSGATAMGTVGSLDARERRLLAAFLESL